MQKIGTVKTNHPSHRVESLYYSDNWEDQIDYAPNVFVSVEEEDIQTWQAAIREFAVGRGEVSSFRFADYYLHLTHVRGMVAGFKNAQAFYKDFNVCSDKLLTFSRNEISKLKEKEEISIIKDNEM